MGDQHGCKYLKKLIANCGMLQGEIQSANK